MCISRCTGYRPILDAFKCFASHHNSNDKGKVMIFKLYNLSVLKTCPSTGLPCDCSYVADHGHQNENRENEFNKDLIFPPELKRRKLTYLEIKGNVV